MSGRDKRGDFAMMKAPMDVFIGAIVNPGVINEQGMEIQVEPNLEVIICYSHCLYCGRRTPHEACHAHASALVPDAMPIEDPEERGRWQAMEPEECFDPNCPVWEPEERERFEPWYKEWVKQRDAVGEAVHGAWMRSMWGQGFANHEYVHRVEDLKRMNTSPRCGFEQPYGPCNRPPQKHHARMKPWGDLTRKEQIEQMPPGLDRAFKAGYEAASAAAIEEQRHAGWESEDARTD